MRTFPRLTGNVVLLAVFLLCVSTGSAMGAGFALIEQSVSGLGNAYAGGSAAAEDATTIFFNPAGMTRLDGQQVVAGFHIVIPSAKFTNEGSTHVLQSVTRAPLLGNNGGDAGVTKGIPNLYYSVKLSPRLVLGLGVNAPFGLATDYESGWVGRYHALKSDVLNININPSVAYKLTDQLSAGAGISVQYLKAKLSNAIDFGTLDALGKLGLPAGALRLTPQLSDGSVKMEGDSWGVGYNLGLLYEFTNSTRMGVAYRSRIDHTLEGDATFSNVPAGLSPVPVFRNTGVKADVTLPDSLSVSLFHSITPQWMVMADFTWTNWSLFKELRVKFDNPNQPDSVTTELWQDSYRYSLGLSYVPDSSWIFRTGIAYDTAAVADAEHRTPRIPDADRFWIALGAGYKISKALSIDIGYAHLFISDEKVNKTPTGEDAVRGGLVGSYDNNINIVSAQISLKF
ncbi:MAG TPA: outer membrane protein transport protein [Thermodesulfovibrionales bacterium]|nr:outer membrane protein transport protein [Thermodesulfovibrionales bacterium]